MRLRDLAAILLAVALLPGCISERLRGFLPPVYEYTSLLVPDGGEDAAYSVNPDGSMTYDEEGLRVTVRPLSDAELLEPGAGLLCP